MKRTIDFPHEQVQSGGSGKKYLWILGSSWSTVAWGPNPSLGLNPLAEHLVSHAGCESVPESEFRTQFQMFRYDDVHGDDGYVEARGDDGDNDDDLQDHGDDVHGDDDDAEERDAST